MKQSYEYKKKKKSILTILLSLVLIAGVVFLGGIFYYNSLLSPVDVDGEDQIIEIPKGYSVKKIASLLEEEGIIKKGFAFQIAVRVEKVQGQLQSGKYVLNSAMDTKEVIAKITSGEVLDDSIKVTVPEGFELTMIAERLAESGITSSDEFIEEAKDLDRYDYDFLKDIPPDRDNPLEGYLFPDTYHFPPDATNEEIIDAMLKRFDEVFKKEYYTRVQELDMNIDEIVTLASVVEREARVASDRPIISGVFHNRLKKGWKLESCATVQYILGERKPRLLYSDLEVESPYNTYMYSGLPIGPIASFGEASLKATLYPEKTDYLFFVAKDDGSHVFSKTLAEHNAAKDQVLN